MPIIKKHQTLLDFATQHSGLGEGLLDVAKLNGLSVTDDVLPGNELQCPSLEEKTIASFIKSKLNIATDSVKGSEGHALEGIGYWIIGLDFKVS